MDLKALLLSGRLPQDVVPVDGVGEVRVRGLSRKEVAAVGRAIREDGLTADDTEALYIAKGMVEPTLTEEEAAGWRESASSAEVIKVLNRILELSGLAEGAAKSDL